MPIHMKSQQEWETLATLSTRLGVSRPTLRALVEKGELVAIKGEGRTSPLRIQRSSVEAWLSRARISPARVA